MTAVRFFAPLALDASPYARNRSAVSVFSSLFVIPDRPADRRDIAGSPA